MSEIQLKPSHSQSVQHWIKQGRIFSPDSALWWQQHHGILPTPWRQKDGSLRVLYASTDEQQYGRIGSIRLKGEDGAVTTSREDRILLDIGEPGRFDDCGVNPSCILNAQDHTYLFYVGYQRGVRTPYSLLTGLAVWEEQTATFKRISKAALFERGEQEFFIRSAPCVLPESEGFRAWYVCGLRWEFDRGFILPRYELRTMATRDLFDWPTQGQTCTGLGPREGEAGFGRPWVIWNSERALFQMWFSVRELAKDGGLVYRKFGYAESKNGLDWCRLDLNVELSCSALGWDSEMICYAAIVPEDNRYLMFYNGNRNGKTGFGLAELAME